MRVMLAAVLLSTGLGWAGSASAQSALDSRVDRLEREMKAVQRKVFPGGSDQYFTPEITPQQQPQAVPGTPASDPVIALEARVSALEKQVASMTGQVEQTQYRVQQAEESFAAYKKATDARLRALEGGGPGLGSAGGAPIDDMGAGADDGRSTSSFPSSGNSAADSPAAKPAATGARADKLAAIDKPSTGDPADDAYVYGYRLWDAGLYPEAEAQLKSVVKKYPDHRRASWAQNLLGRAYLDEGKPSLASIAFYDNYKKMPNGERAPDSLFYLGKALIELKKPKDACQVYAELTDVYGSKISAEMTAKVQQARDTAKCQ
ncbi:hypothetical protein KY084_14335 [Stakelama sp. CBK3Z-3]|uniref:Tetratricopeptide repeat protein n=2 Tax=Stakelama flava TaxID=2860338 RepID=A0ABS6XPA5_9SPHN|nr:hypothetical protein [Stakelama flava]